MVLEVACDGFTRNFSRGSDFVGADAVAFHLEDPLDRGQDLDRKSPSHRLAV
jgi:hypothetical protein